MGVILTQNRQRGNVTPAVPNVDWGLRPSVLE
jgi:hypothetical protein